MKNQAIDNKELILALEELEKEKGIKKGIKQGREEERREIAQNLKSLGLSLEDISKATGLTSEEIEQL